MSVLFSYRVLKSYIISKSYIFVSHMSLLTYVADRDECYSIVNSEVLWLKSSARVLELVKVPQTFDRATIFMENILLYDPNSWNISIRNTKSWLHV